MDVTIEPFISASVATGKEVRFEQYRIRVNGQHAGYMGTKPGSKILLTTRFTPMEVSQIELEVAKAVGIVESGPPELLKPQREDEVDADDFD